MSYKKTTLRADIFQVSILMSGLNCVLTFGYYVRFHGVLLERIHCLDPKNKNFRAEYPLRLNQEMDPDSAAPSQPWILFTVRNLTLGQYVFEFKIQFLNSQSGLVSGFGIFVWRCIIRMDSLLGSRMNKFSAECLLLLDQEMNPDNADLSQFGILSHFMKLILNYNSGSTLLTRR